MATKPDEIRRIAWDSVACISFLERDKARYPHLRPIAEDAVAKRTIIVVSTMAVAETYSLKDVEPDQQAARIEGFFDASYVHVHAFERFVAVRTREIRRAYKMDPADAVHVGTAAFTGCEILITNDGQSEKTKRNLLKYDGLIDTGPEGGGRKLRIMTPAEYDAEEHRRRNPIFSEATARATVAFGQVDRVLHLSGPESTQQAEPEKPKSLPPPSA